MRVLVERQASGPSVCEFGWGAYRKHSDVWVTTPTFTIAHFEQALTKAAVEASQLERNDP